MIEDPALADLAEEARRLIFPRFAEDTALALGLKLVELAQSGNLPVVIDIRTPDRCLFHAALPGSTPMNGLWAARKSATALMFQEASLQVGLRHRKRGETLAKHGLPAERYADHGGAVPIRVEGAGVVACVTVSGLPQVEDHRLAIRAIEAVLAGS